MTLKNYHTGRRYTAYVNTLGTTQLHLRSPWVVAFWSMMFPGLGHVLRSQYLRGYILFLWEVFINLQGHINMAIFHSFLGDFEAAKQVLDTRWALIYIPVYFFAIWDSFRSAVDLNNQYVLAARENGALKPFKLDAVEINYLDKKCPITSALWSMVTPGLGQLSINRLASAFFMLTWAMVIVFLSNLLPAVHETWVGNFAQGKMLLNVQWFLNIPSVYFYAAYDAYVNTVEGNKLFDREQANFFKRRYQTSNFKMPSLKRSGSGCMYIVSTFKHSIMLEQAITAVEQKGIARENILAVSLDKRDEKQKLFDSMHQSDGISILDVPFILGSFLALMGAIYGFNFYLGPLLWGIIGFIVGAALGLAIKLIINRKHIRYRSQQQNPEVVLIVECGENEADTVKDLLWEHDAMGVRKLELGRSQASAS